MSTGTPVLAVQNMPARYLEEFNASRSYIVNITDTEYHLSRTYGNYLIPAKASSERFSMMEVTPRKGVIDIGDRKVLEFPITPEEVADDLCREVNNEAGYLSFMGVFRCAGRVPTDRELEDAEAKLEKFYQWCVAEGDKIWQQTRLVILIPDHLKRAAAYLKLDREWKTNVQPKVECPACGINLRPGLAVCSGCGAVLDMEKARKFFPDRFAPTVDASEVDLAGDDPANLAGRKPKASKKAHKETASS